MDYNSNPGPTISSSEALEALNRAEVDIQVETAKRWPAHSTPDQIAAALRKAEAFALVDSETAESCFYRLERQGKNGERTVIEGPSVRLAEIIAASWGNLRIATQIVGNDGRFITARGACHDLESNVAQIVETRRGITTSKGYTFSADMQTVTGNAAAAIARRNAILAVIPAAVFKPLYGRIREFVLGEVTNDLENRRAKMLRTFATAGVTREMILEYLGVPDISGVDAEMMTRLVGVWNAIRDGQTTVEETFRRHKEADQKSDAARIMEQSRKTAAKAAQGARQPSDDMPEEVAGA